MLGGGWTELTSEDAGRQYTIQALDAAIDIIEFLVHTDENGVEATATEISRRVGLHRNRVFRILKTLEYRNYVEVDPQTRVYGLGIKFLHLGQHVQKRLGVREAAEAILKELARKTGDVASVWVQAETTAVCVDWEKGPHMLQSLPSIGRALPLYVGAAPKVLLAHLGQQERDRLLSEVAFEAFTSNTITDSGVLETRLREIRSQGYAVDEEDYEYGEHAVGAPVRDHTGQVVAALSVAVPKTRYRPDRRELLIEYVVEAGYRVSQNLGFAG